MFSVTFHQQDSGKNIKDHEDISKVLSKYTGEFPDQLSKGLPPKQTEKDFQVELKEDAKPIKKGLCRMSHTEFEETKKQVEHLIEMGFVQPSKIPGRLLYCLQVTKTEVYDFV